MSYNLTFGDAGTVTKLTFGDAGTIEVYKDSIKLLGRWSKQDLEVLERQLNEELPIMIEQLQKQGPMLKEETRNSKIREIGIMHGILKHIATGPTFESAPKKLDKSFIGNISFGDSGTIQVYGDSIKLLGKWSESDLEAVAKKLRKEMPMLKEQLEKQGPSLKEQTRNDKIREIAINEKILEHIDAGRIVRNVR
ncbi:MAG: hypothetical protein WCL71_14645 [Deltaproteobacteria bacterium]